MYLLSEIAVENRGIPLGFRFPVNLAAIKAGYTSVRNIAGGTVRFSALASQI